MTPSSKILRSVAGGLAMVALAVTPGAAFAAAPANDVCSSAAAVPPSGPFPYTTTVDTTQATNAAGDVDFICNTKFQNPAPAGAVSHSVWFAFTPASTDNYQIDTIGSTPSGTYDTILGLYTGICGTLSPVTDGCSDDTAGSLQSAVQVRLNAGTTYYILVAGLGSRNPNNNQITPSAGGSLKLNVSRVPVNYPYSYVIPSVAHAQGNTLYVSDLSVTNIEGTDGSFTLQFLNHGSIGGLTQPSPQPVTAPTTIRAGGSVLFGDVLANGFGIDVSTNPYGGLLIRSTVKLQAGARTYTRGTAGSFGQFALAVDTSTELLASGESGWLIGMHEDSTTRTNIALVNLGTNACNIRFELLDTNGAHYTSGDQTRSMPPFTMAQQSGLKNGLFAAAGDIVNAAVKVTNTTNGCKIGGVAYVIDGNPLGGGATGTSDPFAVPLLK